MPKNRRVIASNACDHEESRTLGHKAEAPPTPGGVGLAKPNLGRDHNTFQHDSFLKPFGFGADALHDISSGTFSSASGLSKAQEMAHEVQRMTLPGVTR